MESLRHTFEQASRSSQGSESSKDELAGYLCQHEEDIIDSATDWVFNTAIDLGKAGREISLTRKLVERVVRCNIEWLRHGNIEPTEAFIEFVTTLRADDSFHMSTLLRGFFSCRMAAASRFESDSLDAERKFVYLALLDAWYHESIYEVGDRFTSKLNGILLTQQEKIREHEKERHRREAESARAANEAKTTFLANISHELRTPLTSILGYGEILAQSDTFRGEERDMLETIHESSQHLLSVINSVLDMSKIEAGHLDWLEDPTDLNKLVKMAFDILKRQAEKKGLTYELRLATDQPTWVRADAPKLSQIFINLIGNAVKFTQAGSVLVDFRHGPAKEADAQAMRFEVRDTGPGIPVEAQKRIFSPFEQAGNTRTGGTGLGLPISQRLLQNLGSKLQLVSKPGDGSTFWFELVLPSCTPPSTQDESLPAQATSPSLPVRRGRVLVVDDEANNRKLLGRMLRHVECDVRFAEDAQEARLAVRAEPPDLILMDKRLPDCDGFVLASELHKQINNPNLRIIAITADVFNIEEAQALSPHINGILSKPFVVNEMRERVRNELKLACR